MLRKTTELSRKIDLSDIYEHKGVTLDIRASSDECKALAERCHILEVQDMNAHITLKPTARREIIKIEGDLMAHVVQECCVTLAPVIETIDESFKETVTTSEEALVPESEIDGDDDKPVALVEGDQIDIGEIVAQWLTLSLNPFPRSDAPLYEYIEEKTGDHEAGTHTPFSVLGKLKDK